MKKYNIYRMNDDEQIGEVIATDTISAERNFLKVNTEYGSLEIYALSAE